MNKLITLTGPSGSGKSTIENILVNKYGYRKAISHTSRAMRLNEEHGKDYYFVDELIIRKLYDERKLAEFTCYNNNYYGVMIDELERSQVIVIEPHGLKQVKERMKNSNTEVISIYIGIDSETQIERMKRRGDSNINIQKRVSEDIDRFKPDPELYDFIFKSDNRADYNTNLAEFINNIIDKNNVVITKDIYRFLTTSIEIKDESDEQNN